MAEAVERDYRQRSYGARQIGFGHRPGVVVIDFQKAFTDPRYPLGGAPLVMRAVDNTGRVLEVARRHNFPVASCYTAYGSEREMPHWKVGAVREQFILGDPSTELEPRIHEPGYDMALCKPGPSIFFQTPVVPFFVRERVDTVIVTGCITSGCVRASTIDSFQWGFRTIVPEDCVGDHEEQPHEDNLRDVGRRYADISSADEVIAYFEEVGRRNI
ncbi:MAG TPA: isochorismatase family protein [Geminicoccaceae bacterium]|nr:isochorismatase family protein [Geminicoccaceae bacterium]